MIYDKYRKRMDKVVKILAFLSKYKFAIISAFVALTLSVSGILFARGTVSGYSMPINEFVYGEVELSLNAKAFLSEVKYEFKKDGEEWTEQQPKTPGKYTIRARANGSFGKEKYSEEFTFTILPRAVTFAIDDNYNLAYGGFLPTKITDGSLAQGEVFDSGSCEFGFSGLGTDDVKVTPKKETIKIIRPSDGADVTACYQIDVVEKKVRLNSLDINVSVNNGETLSKVYDGTELCVDKSHIVYTGENKVYNGDVLEFDFGSGVINVKDGEKTSNVTLLKATNSEGIDVTEYYNVKIQQTKLKINPREISLSSPNKEKEYNGEPWVFTAKDEQFSDTGVAEGEKVVANFAFYSKTIKNVADSTNNDFTFTIVRGQTVIYDSENEKHQTNTNYTVNKKVGKLTVKPFELEISAHNHQDFVYSGDDHGCGEIGCQGYGNLELANNSHVITIKKHVLKTDVGEYDNVIEKEDVEILDGSEDVTANYKIDCKKGKLAILPYEITFVSHSHDYGYDTQIHGCGKDGCPGYDNTPLNHTIKITNKAPLITNYEGENGLSNLFSAGMIEIWNDGKDVTKNYAITFAQTDENGDAPTLYVEKASLTIFAHNHSYTYDANAHGCVDDKSNCQGYGITEFGHSITILDSSSCVEYDENGYENVIEVENVKIYDGTTEVTRNYNISCEDGELFINKRAIVILPHTHTCEYDGNAHGCGYLSCCEGYDNDDVISENKLVGEHSIKLIAGQLSERIDAGEIVNTIKVEIFDGENSTDYNYSVSYANADGNGQTPKIIVTKRDIKIQNHTHHYVYDGEEHGCGIDCLYGQEFTADRLVNGHVIEFSGSTTQPIHYQEGGYDNQITVIIKYGTTPVTDNYEISYSDGKIHIDKRQILIQTHNHVDCTYDGNAHGCGKTHCCSGYSGADVLNVGQTIDGVKYYSLIENYTIKVYGAKNVTNVYDGEINNEVWFNILDDENVIVYGEGAEYQDFIVKTVLGKLKVNPRPIEITSHTHSDWIYDGDKHACGVDGYCDGYDSDVVTSGELVYGHTIEVCPETYLVDAKDKETNVVVVKIYDNNGDLVYDFYDEIENDNYLVEYKYGELTVSKRQITITTHSHEWIYDGKEHNCVLSDCDGYDNNDIHSENKLVEKYRHYVYSYDSNVKVKYVSGSGAINKLVEGKTIIKDSNGEDVTKNYDICYEEVGILTIKHRPITIYGVSKEKVYDGYRLQVEEGEYDKEKTERKVKDSQLADNEQIYAIENFGEYIVNVWESGEKTNIKVGSVKIEDINKNDTTENYQFFYEQGQLKITPRPIKIELHGHKCVYDGIFHACGKENNHTEPNDRCNCCSGYTSDDLVDIDGKNFYSLVGDPTIGYHYVVIVDADGRTNVGKTLNNVAFKIFDAQDNLMYDFGSEIENDNYSVTIKQGNFIEVTHRPITITTNDGEKVYDATPYEPVNIVNFSEIDLAPNERIIDIKFEDIIHVKQTAEQNNKVTFDIKNVDEVSTFSNYVITKDFGKITITQKAITIATKSDVIKYNGNAYENLAVGESYQSVISLGALAQGDDISAIFWGKPIINAGEHLNGIEKIVIVYFDAEQEIYNGGEKSSKTANYDISWDFGTITINKRDITIKTVVVDNYTDYLDFSKTYDGLEEQTAVRIGGDGIADGQEFVGNIRSIIFVNESGELSFENGYGVQYVDGRNEVDGVKVIENYNVDVTYGVLTISKKDLSISTFGGTRLYDGLPFDGDYTVNGLAQTDAFEGELRTVVHVKDSGLYDFTDGYTINHIDKGDAKDNYNITEQFDTVIINQRQITIETNTDTKEYDANAYNGSMIVNVGGDGLVQGENIDDIVFVEIINVPGGENAIIRLFIYYLDGTSATYEYDNVQIDANYNITWDFGTITITPKEITITAHDHEYSYDTNNHGCCIQGDCEGGYGTTEFGHKIVIMVSTIASEVGVYTNKIATVKILDGETEVTGNYTFLYEDGVIEITTENIDDEEDEKEDGGDDDNGVPQFPEGGDIQGSSSDADGNEDVVMFKVKSDKGGTIYLRLYSYGEYHYTGWDAGKIFTNSEVTVNPLYFVALALNGQQEENRVEPSNIEIMENPDLEIVEKYMIPLYVLDSGVNTLNDVCISKDWDGTGSYTLSYYTYQGQTISLEGTDYEEMEKCYREYVYEEYTKLPDDTKARLFDIATKEKGIDINSDTIILDVAEVVRKEVEYNGEFKSVYDGKDVAVYFFDEATDGICQHYATAATAMYRALGIPARYTGGFVANTQAGVTTDVKGGQAHAWVEVYYDGIGWMKVEVTGGGNFPGNDGLPGNNGGGADGEGGSQDTPKIPLYLKPKDLKGSSSEYGENNPLKFNEIERGPVKDEKGNIIDNSIIDQTGHSEWYTLLKEGYSYEAVIEGEAKYPGKVVQSHISKITIYDEKGNDVSDNFGIDYKYGKIEIGYCYLYVDIYSQTTLYNGKAQCYAQNTDYKINTSKSDKSVVDGNFTIEFGDFSTVTMTDAGQLSEEDLLPILTVRNAKGEDVTDQCLIEFSSLMRIEQLEITVTSVSAHKEYDGTALCPNDDVVLKQGYKLPEGHKIVGKATGSITEVGNAKNSITSVRVIDENGNDVTKNYSIFKKEGVLLVIEPEE